MSGNSSVSLNEFKTALVKRTSVSDGLAYTEYKQTLRFDFYYSCAYCCIAEAEAGGVRFTIDHYEPQKARTDLVNCYSNLMWACDECNRRKGDRTPPPAARTQGYRFFRPDSDVHLEHFTLDGNIIRHNTKIAYYTIESLDLNREGLQRIRDIRRRIYACDEAIAGGVRSLMKFPIDRLPTNIRGPALRAIKQLKDTCDAIETAIDGALREQARSHLLDDDYSAEERAKERKVKLQALEGLFPGEWRGPRAPRKT